MWIFTLFLYGRFSAVAGCSPIAGEGSWGADHSGGRTCGVRGGSSWLLTFDDGPDPIYTPRLLDGLKERDVKSQHFFLIGKMLEGNEDIVERMFKEGT